MKRDYLKYKDMSEIEQRLFSLRWYHTLKIGEDAFREMCLYLDSHRVNKYRFFELLEQVVYMAFSVKEQLGWNAFIFGSHGVHNKQFNKDGSKKYTPWVEGMDSRQVTRYLHTMKKLDIIKLHKPGTNSKYHENKAAMYSWQGYGFFEKNKVELNDVENNEPNLNGDTMERHIPDELIAEVCENWGYKWDVEMQRVIDPGTGKDAFETYATCKNQKEDKYEGLTEEQIIKKKHNRRYFSEWYQQNKEKLRQKRMMKKEESKNEQL